MKKYRALYYLLITLLFFGAAACHAEVIELTPKSEIVLEGDYRLSGLFTDILTDRSRQDGWGYYYSVGTDPVVPTLDWTCAPGMYTTCELLFDMTGLAEAPAKGFGDRFSGVIVYNTPGDFPITTLGNDYILTLRTLTDTTPGAELFVLTAHQDNPGQLDTDGYPARCRDIFPLKLNETAKQSLIADVSEAFYRSWEDPNGSASMWAFFSYGNDIIYAVDLRTWMEEF